MAGRENPNGLMLTEEEAFALLGLCLTSPTGLDAHSEKALRKLADYCSSSYSYSYRNARQPIARELGKAGA